MTPLGIGIGFAHGYEWRGLIAGMVLGAAWLTNFTVFFRAPRELAWIPVAIPWVWFMMFWLEWYPGGRGFVGFLPFYVWAIGIGLIHGSVYPKKEDARELAGLRNP